MEEAVRLPDDEHRGWDRLISAVLEDDDRTTSDDETGAQDLEALLDLASLQARAGAIVGNVDSPSATI